MEDKVKKTEPQANSLTNNLTNSLTVSKISNLDPKLIIGLALAILLGVGTGYIFSRKGSVNSLSGAGSVGTSTESKNAVGSSDAKTFKDTATGTLKEGGIKDEGAFHLVRPGGDSQNVYLTSSIVDLSAFVGKKVKVWGQTLKAQTAGWLMDVGRIEVAN